ncbi:MAG: hypothetical protein D8M52_06350 [Chlorobi bacterium]|nr:hypothetical protein [Chlorobiota bacterium]NOG67791.1 hypothetical protein [Chlorobiota bacterium]
MFATRLCNSIRASSQSLQRSIVGGWPLVIGTIAGITYLCWCYAADVAKECRPISFDQVLDTWATLALATFIASVLDKRKTAADGTRMLLDQEIERLGSEMDEYYAKSSDLLHGDKGVSYDILVPLLNSIQTRIKFVKDHRPSLLDELDSISGCIYFTEKMLEESRTKPNTVANSVSMIRTLQTVSHKSCLTARMKLVQE